MPPPTAEELRNPLRHQRRHLHRRPRRTLLRLRVSIAVAKGRAAGGGQLRIVGGRHRGRRLPIPSQPGLRPTTDRTRETLFNWLAPVIEGSRCLDCFAGSGALGFEAASRGASAVTMVERSVTVCRQLRANAVKLGDQSVQVVDADALAWLAAAPVQPFDVVFLDPPFGRDMLSPACELLHRRGWLRRDAQIYLEASAAEDFPNLPPGWILARDKRAGGVRFGLVWSKSEFEPESEPEP